MNEELFHDLRGQLTVVEGFVDILLRQGDDLDPADREAHLERIRSAARAMAERLERAEREGGA
jgi:K+-sensing histidine kinase KdpD